MLLLCPPFRMEEDEAPPYVAMFMGNKQKPLSLTLVPSDPISRYKTRQLQVSVTTLSLQLLMVRQIQFEGRGSKRTSLVNINDVAKDMRVPASCKFVDILINSG